jgi:hypothetical protein
LEKKIQATGQLFYFNLGGGWSADIDKAVVTFNSLGFPVRYVLAKEKKNANVVIKLAVGSDSETFDGSTLSTNANFDPALLHGDTKTLTEVNDRAKTAEMIFAVTFLPGKAKATKGQKEAIIVHELIHACGLDGGKPDGTKNKDQDHDSEGILFAIMNTTADGLIEATAPAGVKPMPPIRVGGQTRCKIQMIWGTEACKKD